MDYSFYGGRRGAAFVITGRFASIQEMITNFSQGGNYSVINYDEYVIIDTVNKNDPDNGKIYRRGYNYQDELGGAQYVGQIVGPSGLAPKVEMTTIDKVKEMQEQEGYEYRKSKGEYAPTENLIPGKDGDTYHDSIKWACCSVRDKNNKDTTAYVGFTFPYTVIEYTADSVDPYYHRSNDGKDFTNENLIDREDDASHPYFEKWHISIPKGIKGNALKNFRIIDATDIDNINTYEGQADDRSGKKKTTFDQEDLTRKIAVYDYYDYSKDPTGEPVSLYLGDYNIISDVAFDNDGTVRISYTHDDDSVWENKFKWINDISITPQGIFTINYNYGGEATKYQTTLSWIDKVDFSDDGTIKFIYNDGNTENIEFTNKIQWVTGVTLADDGTLTFSYNNGTKDTIFTKTIKWITDINLDEKGTLKVSYNNDTPASIWEKYIKWITNIQVDNEGSIIVSYNNDTPDSKWEKLIKWITDITINDEGTLSISYNNGTPNSDFPKVIKWISNILLADDGTLSIQYNNGDPDTIFNKKIKWITDISLLDNGQLTMNFNNGDAALKKTLRWITDCTFSDNGDFTLKFNDGFPDVTQHIKWIKNVNINTGNQEGEGNQKLHITYNDGEEQDIGNSLNYIIQTVVDPVTFHLLILYSDPKKREAIIQAGLNATYNGRNDWQDCGCVKDYDGILIGTNFSIDHFIDPTIEGIVKQLNEELPKGFSEDDAKHYGRVVTVGNNQNNNKIFFGFDYKIKEDHNYAGWYYLGGFPEYPGVIAGRIDDQSTVAAASALPTGSVWLVLQ